MRFTGSEAESHQGLLYACFELQQRQEQETKAIDGVTALFSGVRAEASILGERIQGFA